MKSSHPPTSTSTKQEPRMNTSTTRSSSRIKGWVTRRSGSNKNNSISSISTSCSIDHTTITQQPHKLDHPQDENPKISIPPSSPSFTSMTSPNNKMNTGNDKNIIQPNNPSRMSLSLPCDNDNLTTPMDHPVHERKRTNCTASSTGSKSTNRSHSDPIKIQKKKKMNKGMEDRDFFSTYNNYFSPIATTALSSDVEITSSTTSTTQEDTTTSKIIDPTRSMTMSRNSTLTTITSSTIPICMGETANDVDPIASHSNHNRLRHDRNENTTTDTIQQQKQQQQIEQFKEQIQYQQSIIHQFQQQNELLLRYLEDAHIKIPREASTDPIPMTIPSISSTTTLQHRQSNAKMPTTQYPTKGIPTTVSNRVSLDCQTTMSPKRKRLSADTSFLQSPATTGTIPNRSPSTTTATTAGSTSTSTSAIPSSVDHEMLIEHSSKDHDEDHVFDEDMESCSSQYSSQTIDPMIAADKNKINDRSLFIPANSKQLINKEHASINRNNHHLLIETTEQSKVASGSKFEVAKEKNKKQPQKTTTANMKDMNNNNNSGWVSNQTARSFLNMDQTIKSTKSNRTPTFASPPSTHVYNVTNARRSPLSISSIPNENHNNLDMNKNLDRNSMINTSITSNTESSKCDDPTFVYKEVVRNQKIRQQLNCYDCVQCRKFYTALNRGCNDTDTNDIPICHPIATNTSNKNVENNNNNRMSHTSFGRHRARFAPSETPDDFWELDFIDERDPK